MGLDQIEFMPSKERAEQLAAILTTVQDGILVVDNKGNITQCNLSADRILMLSESEVLGSKINAVFFKKLYIDETIRTGQGLRNQEIYLASAGNYCVISTIPFKRQR